MWPGPIGDLLTWAASIGTCYYPGFSLILFIHAGQEHSLQWTSSPLSQFQMIYVEVKNYISQKIKQHVHLV